MGVSGAGKTAVGTRLADALGVPFLEGDELHSAHSVRKMARGIPLTDADRRGWVFEKVTGDMVLIRRLIEGDWEEDFLRLEPGEKVTMTYDHAVIGCTAI